MTPAYVIWHHSLTADGNVVDTQAIRRYHVDIKGWLDIGYHYLIEKINDQWEILKGRMDNEDGAHCIAFNNDSLGICVVGNFDLAVPEPDLWKLMVRFQRSLLYTHRIPREKVMGHWETYQWRGVPVEKSCPGTRFLMTEFRKML
jgi:N-acetylmuramoyl-L-alanine amidase